MEAVITLKQQRQLWLRSTRLAERTQRPSFFCPPHSGSVNSAGNELETYALTERDSLQKSEHGKLFVDWASACHTLRHGGKRVHVYTILNALMTGPHVGYYNYLSTMTGGACMITNFDQRNSSVISRITVPLLLDWMGVEKDGLSDAAKGKDMGAKLTQYIDIRNIKKMTSEIDAYARSFFNSPDVPSNTT